MNDFIVNIAFPVRAEDMHDAIHKAGEAARLGKEFAEEELAYQVSPPFIVSVKSNCPNWLTS